MVTAKTKRRRRARSKTFDPTTLLFSSGEFLSRELSWLQFNHRVLSQAEATARPLLERLRFLTICTSNLDEFFMNRFGGFKQRLESGAGIGVLPHDQTQHFLQIRSAVAALTSRQDSLLLTSLLPSLDQNGIKLLDWKTLSREERDVATTFFTSNIFPVLTPQAVDPGHPFPAISNLSLSLGVLLRNPDHGEQLFARIKIPSVIPQIVRLPTEPGEHFRGVTTSEVIRHNLNMLFPGMEIENVMQFRLTRNAELDIDEFETDDLRASIAEGLKERKFAQAVRLERAPGESSPISDFLMDEVEVASEDVYVSTSSIMHGALREIADLPIPHLRFEPWSPLPSPQFPEEDGMIFSAIKSGDILVHHPYESFNLTVERFLRVAVEDPKVLSIKMTLYRSGDNSSLIPLLIRAAELDKQVVCLIEVKASFDEARNIQLAERLENAGVHVMYGVVGLKTHAKLILVARQENDAIRCYCHIGTGNYNSTTARVYTDLGLFTSHSQICADIVDLFHYLTGRSLKKTYSSILVAPSGLKEKLIALIEQEIANHQKGLPAHIAIKANSLEDHAVCRALSKAARAGVAVDLIIRGICCLKPEALGNGYSPRVVSIIGRFLEHSRIYYFRDAQTDPLFGQMFISSADPMYRNLHRRVEVAVPVLDPRCKLRCWEVLSAAIFDSQSAWDLLPDGTYTPRPPEESSPSQGSQQLLMRLSKDRSRPPCID